MKCGWYFSANYPDVRKHPTAKKGTIAKLKPTVATEDSSNPVEEDSEVLNK